MDRAVGWKCFQQATIAGLVGAHMLSRAVVGGSNGYFLRAAGSPK
jgi:hypothetical protein